MTWPWSKPPGLQPNDRVTLCPDCGSPHSFSLRRIHTSVIRNGRYVCLDTGSEHVCINPGCGCHFAATDKGTRKLGSPPVAHQDSTAQVEGKPAPVVRLTPRERKAGV